MTERDSYRIADLGDCGYVLKKYLNLSDCKIEEINYIARHMQQITEEEDHIYDEMISLKITDEVKTLPVGVFIDAFANMNKMEFHPGVYDDKSLGEIALEAQMMPWMEQIPDEALPFLSYEKIGECIRKQENGFLQPGMDITPSACLNGKRFITQYLWRIQIGNRPYFLWRWRTRRLEFPYGLNYPVARKRWRKHVWLYGLKI